MLAGAGGWVWAAASAAAFPAPPAPSSPDGAADPAPRLAAIDWAMLETAIAIGHMPAAACELIRFRADAITPAIPENVVDLGLRGAPNMELLQLTRPTLILSSPYYTRHEARLSAIAPVLSLPFFTPGEPPLLKALAALTALADAIGDPAAGQAARSAAETAFDAAADRLRGQADRPLAIIDIGDQRHMRVFGHDSLFGSTATRLGLRNAWTEGTQFRFLAPVPIERLAQMPDATLILTGPPPPEAQRGLDRSVLWNRLPQVAAGRVHILPPANAFGGTPAALRFAAGLEQALTGRAAA